MADYANANPPYAAYQSHIVDRRALANSLRSLAERAVQIDVPSPLAGEGISVSCRSPISDEGYLRRTI